MAGTKRTNAIVRMREARRSERARQARTAKTDTIGASANGLQTTGSESSVRHVTIVVNDGVYRALPIIFHDMTLTFRQLARVQRRALGLWVVAAIVGCAPKAAPPAAAPTPAAPAAPTIMQTCPDPTDGPSIVISAVEDAHRALVANPSTPLPPVCVLTAYTNIPRTLPDSINTHALAIATALRGRGSEQRELLASEVILLARTRRYADVSRTYDRLIALDSQPALEVSRLAMTAALQRGDTASLIRVLTKASTHPSATPAYRAELNVIRQVGALWQAINEARGLLRQNPRYVAAYPSLVGNFGTLGLTDSVIATIRRALAANATRASLQTSLETYVSATLRHASLFGATAGWDPIITAATRVDSALTTPSTKFLVAALIVQAAEPRIAEISSLVSGTSWLPVSTGASAADQRTQNKASGCQRVPALATLLNSAEARMRDGGSRYAGGGVPQITAGLSTAKERLAGLEEVCARGS